MVIILVYIHVKPESVEEFKKASIENAKHSIAEPGVAQFDVIQQKDDPTKFVFLEVYLSEDGSAKHHETEHYQNWRQIVEPMMAESRSRNQYTTVFPGEYFWQ